MQFEKATMPNTILDRFRISRNVYSIVPVGRPVTFQSQQIRAFNLIWALHAAKLLVPESRVAIVGAGLAGITAAAAAYSKQCNVSIFERHGRPMAMQRKNQSRYIHPNMHRWPYGVLEERTSMPALNWSAASAGVVVEQIDKQWQKICEQAESRIKEYFRYNVEIVQEGALPKVRAQLRKQAKANGPISGCELIFQEFDVVILTVGFGIERYVEDVPFVSYWENDSFEQTKRDSDDAHRILISGCGDGGLIDAQRFCIQNFNHQTVVDELLYHEEYASLREEIARIENVLSVIRDDEQFQIESFRQYRALTDSDNRGWKVFCGLDSSPGLTQLLLRDDVSVTLNSDAVSPLSPRSSALNRFITFALLEKQALRYQQGKLQVTLNRGKFDVKFGDDSIHRFDQLIVRHGPQGALPGLVEEAAINHLKKVWNDTVGDPTVEQRWPTDFYPASLATTEAPTLNHAMEQFPSAFNKLYDRKTVRSICVGTFRGREGYIVQLKGEAKVPRGEKYYGEIPVFYRGTEKSSEDVPVSPAPKLRVGIGSGIYNLKQQENPQLSLEWPKGSQGLFMGTLGMFVNVNNGKLGILSTAVAMARNPNLGRSFKAAEEGDPIHSEVTGQLRSLALFSKGMMASSLPASSDSAEVIRRSAEPLQLDYAIAVISDSGAAKHTLYEIGSPFFTVAGEDYTYPNAVNTAREGDIVYKFGWKTGLTWGRVVKVGSTVEALYTNKIPSKFNNVTIIEPISAPDSQPGQLTRRSGVFAASGDTGAVVFRSDGSAVGLLFADNGSAGYAFDLKSVLAAANCEANFDVASIEI